MRGLSVGVFKLTSCSGCLNELIYALVGHPELMMKLDVKYFTEIQDRTELSEMDLAIVEGSIVNREQENLVKRVRSLAKQVIALGTCASLGGVQSLRVGYDLDKVKRFVYPVPEFVDVYSDVKPLSDVISVDIEIRGCPVDGENLLRVLRSLVEGISIPVQIYEVVCDECKRKGIQCLLVSGRVPCLGPITAAGCGALCPSFGRSCYGCYGVAEKHLTKDKVLEFAKTLEELGMPFEDFKAFLKAYSFRFYRELFGDR